MFAPRKGSVACDSPHLSPSLKGCVCDVGKKEDLQTMIQKVRVAEADAFFGRMLAFPFNKR